MKRIYESIAQYHLNHLNQMVFLAGPRQVGKTTIAKFILEKEEGIYLNWDILKDREIILSGHENIIERLPSPKLGTLPPITVLDEIHKFKDWKNYLKGFYDQCKEQTRIVVTGSSRLDIFVKGGDSLMGRYFPYTVYPITVGEVLSTAKPESPIRLPRPIDNTSWENLWTFGGFPDPFLQATKTFANQWYSLRHQQLFKEDIIDLSRVSDISQLEVLASLIESQVGQLVNYSAYGKSIRSSDQTIRRWFELLESVYYCFRIRPWFKNVSRSLRKEPKVYLWDWSRLKDPGAKTENFIACHLVKSAQLWTQTGMGQFDVFFLRDKEKNEVDFLMVRDEIPWFLVEVKKSSTKLSSSLAFFQQQLDASNAFQVVLDEPYVEEDCFSRQTPIVVPARTFLSQI